MALESVTLPTLKAALWDCGQGAVRSVRYSSDGNYCLTAGSDKTIKLWSVNQVCTGNIKRSIHTFIGHGSEPLDVHASKDNARLVSGGADKLVMIWDVAEGSSIARYRGHAGRINSVAFGSPDCNVVLSASIDTTVKIWDCRSRPAHALIQTLDDAKDTVSVVKAIQNEILTASADGFVRIYDIRMGQMISDYFGSAVYSTSFTHDLQCLLVSTAGQPIRLLDRSSGQLMQEFTGHEAKGEYQLESDIFHGDSLVVSGSEDGHAYIWDMVEAKLVAKLPMNPTTSRSAVVHSLSVHPLKVALLTACHKCVAIWYQNSS